MCHHQNLKTLPTIVSFRSKTCSVHGENFATGRKGGGMCKSLNYTSWTTYSHFTVILYRKHTHTGRMKPLTFLIRSRATSTKQLCVTDFSIMHYIECSIPHLIECSSHIHIHVAEIKAHIELWTPLQPWQEKCLTITPKLRGY